MHTIKIGYILSEPGYRDKMICITGYRQGNGVDPTLLALISSTVIQMYIEARYRIEIATVIAKIIFSLIVFAFVDDTDLAQAASD